MVEKEQAAAAPTIAKTEKVTKASIDAALSEETSAAIRTFADAILHGDDEHRGWLLEAAEEFIAGRPMPPARGKGLQQTPQSGVTGRS